MFYDEFSDTHHHPWHAIGRGSGDPGPGTRGGRGFLGGGGGGSGMPGARKLSSTDLQLVLLAILEQQPRHGYELIRWIETRSGGFYVPSPGVIYPALTYLDEIGHAAVEPDGNRKRYRITDQGRTHLDANRASTEAIIHALGRIGGRMQQVREAFAGLDAIDPAAADELHRARHALKGALLRTRDCTPDEARRIAAILDRATAEILRTAS